MNKKKIYVSHGYGNDDYKLYQSDRIVLYLMKEHPDCLFFHPLRACGWCYNDIPYDDGLNYCLDFLSMADEMWVCPGWEDSTGCKGEIKYCRTHGIPIKFLNTFYEVEEQ